MTNHTPLNDTQTDFKELVIRCLCCSLRLYDKAEDMDIPTYFNTHHDKINKLADTWIDCKAESIEGYAHALCYSNLGYTLSATGYIELVELHWEALKDYWIDVVKYTQKGLDELI